MSYCREETTVDVKAVECELEPGHDGAHVGHIPEDAPGLTWDKHEWNDE